MPRNSYLNSSKRVSRRSFSSSSDNVRRRKRSISPRRRSPDRYRSTVTSRPKNGHRRSRSSSPPRSRVSRVNYNRPAVRPRRRYSPSSRSSSSSSDVAARKFRRTRRIASRSLSSRRSSSSPVARRRPRRDSPSSSPHIPPTTITSTNKFNEKRVEKSPSTHHKVKQIVEKESHHDDNKHMTVARITSISRNVNKDHLIEIFSNFGTVKDVILPTDDILKLPKGYAYVEYDNVESAQSAIEHMNRGQIDGLTLSVNLCDKNRLSQYVTTPVKIKENGVMDTHDNDGSDDPDSRRNRSKVDRKKLASSGSDSEPLARRHRSSSSDSPKGSRRRGSLRSSSSRSTSRSNSRK